MAQVPSIQVQVRVQVLQKFASTSTSTKYYISAIAPTFRSVGWAPYRYIQGGPKK